MLLMFEADKQKCGKNRTGTVIPKISGEEVYSWVFQDGLKYTNICVIGDYLTKNICLIGGSE